MKYVKIGFWMAFGAVFGKFYGELAFKAHGKLIVKGCDVMLKKLQRKQEQMENIQKAQDLEPNS